MHYIHVCFRSEIFEEECCGKAFTYTKKQEELGKLYSVLS